MAYIDDFLVSPSLYGVMLDIEAYQKEKFKIRALMEDLELRRNLKKEKWSRKT